MLIHDAEYTPAEYKKSKGWGHSVYSEALQLAFDAGVKKLGLFHINQDRSDLEMDTIIKTCRQSIADRGNQLDCFAVASDMDFQL